MKSVIAIVLLAAALTLFFDGASLFVRAERFHAQETRMHQMALRHRSYEPASQWKHDERSLLARMKKTQVNGTVMLGFALGALVLSLLAWRAARKIQVRKAKFGATSWAPQTWETETVTIASDVENRYPVASHASAPTESVAVLKEPLERSLDEKKKLSGARGEREIYDALQPLFAEAWTLLDRNPIVRVAGRDFGDVDFVLRGPSGVGVSLDAKNGNLFAWLHNDSLYLRHRWHLNDDGTPQQLPPYPASRAWFIAEWVKERYGFATVRPVICLTKLVDAKKLGRIKGVDVVKVGDLCDCLRRIDTSYTTSGN